MKLVFFVWDGGIILDKYSVGYWTGKDGDLLCILPNIDNNKIAELLLSPVCKSKFQAIICFLFKRYLINNDGNIKQGFKEEDFK